ncbi:hypothetical protein C8R43DRAFT_947815 [Mycena crocata]|nr:hypothetical protein C8R43DRAFT_947815 [Mycena crocata]
MYDKGDGEKIVIGGGQNLTTAAQNYPTLNPSPGAKWVKRLTQDRLGQFNGRHFGDVNLGAALFVRKESGEGWVDLRVWSAPGLTKPTFAEAMKQEFRPASKGEQFGPSWTNHWWKVTLHIPEDWEEYERVQFEFDPGCEVMTIDTDGTPLQGAITGGFGGDRRVEYLIPAAARQKEVHEIVIESSCNGLFGMAGGGIGPPISTSHFDAISSISSIYRPISERAFLSSTSPPSPRPAHPRFLRSFLSVRYRILAGASSLVTAFVELPPLTCPGRLQYHSTMAKNQRSRAIHFRDARPLSIYSSPSPRPPPYLSTTIISGSTETNSLQHAPVLSRKPGNNRGASIQNWQLVSGDSVGNPTCFLHPQPPIFLLTKMCLCPFRLPADPEKNSTSHPGREGTVETEESSPRHNVHPRSPWVEEVPYTKAESEQASAKLWAIYINEANRYDTALVESWKADMEGMLIFPDSGDMIIQLLAQISQQLAAIANSTVIIPAKHGP